MEASWKEYLLCFVHLVTHIYSCCRAGHKTGFLKIVVEFMNAAKSTQGSLYIILILVEVYF